MDGKHNVDFVRNQACKGLRLDKNKQLQYYKRMYSQAVYDKYTTTDTNQIVSQQEIRLLKILFKVLFKETKYSQRQMLNIPSGNGRLHSLFRKFFRRIDCVDACEGAISKVLE
jgi:hypothetical protein